MVSHLCIEFFSCVQCVFHLDVEFVWVFPIETRQDETFNARDLPELDDVDVMGRISVNHREVINSRKELVEYWLKTCWQWLKVEMPRKCCR